MKNIKEYILNNSKMFIKLTNYGATVMSIFFPNKDGLKEDIILGYDSIDEYVNCNKGAYFGSIVGRYANRIAKGKFTLNNIEYNLAINNDLNHLHGGIKAFDKVIWDAVQVNNEVKFTYISKDMEEGYPGELKISVSYILTSTNELKIKYEANTTKATPINITNHMYFNLSGSKSESILNHKLKINANHITKIDKTLIPTGEILDIRNSALDFTSEKLVGSDINKSNEQLKLACGYDHNYILNKTDESKLRYAATLSDEESSRAMDVYTSQPAVQLYTGNFLDEIVGKNKKIYKKRNALCLETQHYPDSPNKKNFPNTILYPENKFESETIYHFYNK